MVLHAAEDHTEKTESEFHVLEVPLKLMWVITHARNDRLEQQIRRPEQIHQSFASCVPPVNIIAITGQRIAMNAHFM